MRIRVLIIVGCLLVAAVGVARADRNEEIPLRMSFSLFPMELDGWRGIQYAPLADNILAVLGLDDYITRAYVRADRTYADLYVGYWKSQRQGDAIHSPQNCLPGAGWEPVSQSMLTFADPRNPAGPPLTVNRFLIQKGLVRQLVLYWYQSRGRVVGNEYWSKFYLVLDAARYNRTDAALVRVMVKLDGASSEAETAAERSALQFVNALMPALTDFLPN